MGFSLVLVSMVFLSIAFSFSLSVFIKFVRTPYSVPLLFLSLALIFLVVSSAFLVSKEESLVVIFELIAFVCFFLTSSLIYRLFSRVI